MTKAPTASKSAKVAPVHLIKKKKKRRKTSQRRAISEIKKYQQGGKFATSTLIPKSCFARLTRKTAEKYKWDLRFQDDALSGLQTACEAYLVELLNNANKIACTSGRMTLQANDLRLAHSIKSGDEFKMLSKEEEMREASLGASQEEQDDYESEPHSSQEEDYSDISEEDDDDTP